MPHDVSIMRTATIRQLRNDTNTLLDWIEHGETVVITKRQRHVARLVPPEPDTETPVQSPDFHARHKKLFPNGEMKKYNLAELLAEERKRY